MRRQDFAVISALATTFAVYGVWFLTLTQVGDSLGRNPMLGPDSWGWFLAVVIGIGINWTLRHVRRSVSGAPSASGRGPRLTAVISTTFSVLLYVGSALLVYTTWILAGTPRLTDLALFGLFALISILYFGARSLSKRSTVGLRFLALTTAVLVMEGSYWFFAPPVDPMPPTREARVIMNAIEITATVETIAIS